MKDKTQISQPTEKSTVQRALGNVRERNINQHSSEAREQAVEEGWNHRDWPWDLVQAFFRTVWENTNKRRAHLRGDQPKCLFPNGIKIRKRQWKNSATQSNFKLGMT